VLASGNLAPRHRDVHPREPKVAALAAHGVSNAEIAGRHVLAVRSAESYRYHAMTKLGVPSRHDLLFDS
jgi:DNA-binding CsgD family transcriptional regulator